MCERANECVINTMDAIQSAFTDKGAMILSSSTVTAVVKDPTTGKKLVTVKGTCTLTHFDFVHLITECSPKPTCFHKQVHANSLCFRCVFFC